MIVKRACLVWTYLFILVQFFAQQTDQKIDNTIESSRLSKELSFKIGFFHTPFRMIDSPGDNEYGSSLNLTAYGSVKYKRSEILFGPTKIYIPDNELNGRETQINDGNLAVYLSYRYHFETRNSKRLHTYFQFQSLLAKHSYLEYSLGSAPKEINRFLNKHTIGFGTVCTLSSKFDAFAGLNLGINLVTANLGLGYCL